MAVSSAKLQTSVSFIQDIGSLIKRVNKICPIIDPCGITLKISKWELKFKPIFIKCREFVK